MFRLAVGGAAYYGLASIVFPAEASSLGPVGGAVAVAAAAVSAYGVVTSGPMGEPASPEPRPSHSAKLVGYSILLLLHILAGMAWVGGAVALQTTLLAARRSDDPAEVDRVMRSQAWADTWLAVPAPRLVVATGVAMVALSGAWTFTQVWILLSIGLVVAYELIAMTVGARLYRRIAQAREAGALTGAAHANLRAWGRMGGLLLALLLMVVGLMVFKPGVG